MYIYGQVYEWSIQVVTGQHRVALVKRWRKSPFAKPEHESMR